jgi:hypothetical protein
MFLKPLSESLHDFGDVCAMMQERPEEWLRDPAEAAARHRTSMLREVGLGVRGDSAPGLVWLEVGTFTAADKVAWLPVRLEFADKTSFLQSLYGTLDAAWLGGGRTYVAVSAQYELPLHLSQPSDRVLLHLVAELVGATLPE